MYMCVFLIYLCNRDDFISTSHFVSSSVGGAPLNNWPISEQLTEEMERYRSNRKGRPRGLSSAISWGLTVQENPHMALSGVLCSRPLFISKTIVTLSPSTCKVIDIMGGTGVWLCTPYNGRGRGVVMYTIHVAWCWKKLMQLLLP